MKKIFTLLLSILMTLSLVACSKSENTNSENSSEPISSTESTNSSEEAKKNPLDILNTVWANYADNEKFPGASCDFTDENAPTDGPGKYNISDADTMDSVFGMPKSALEKIDNAASLIHTMNANIFTSGVFQVKNLNDVSAVVDSLKENISKRQWICGSPDKLLIITIDNCVVSAFGENNNIETFKSKTLSTYQNAEIVVEEIVE